MKLLTLQKLHKWVALFVGIQLLLWTVSGLVFTLSDPKSVSGELLASPPPPPMLTGEVALADPSAWIGDYADRGVHEVSLRPFDGGWVYRIAHEGGIDLRQAADSARLIIDAVRARRLALDHYRGEGRLVDVRFHAEPTLETRAAGATWRATFDDPDGTSLYFSADDGTLVAARSDTWRVFDFFWMLHTMDYAGRDDFNNPLVIFAGSAALWVGLTGVLLLLRVFRRKTARPGYSGSVDAEIS
ncbi:MAG: PepSY domain-containing protein [Steroidobacteraceae bacterium]